MIGYEEARNIASQKLEQLNANPYDALEALSDCVLLDEYTLVKPYGWVFFYQSKNFMETKNPSDALVGNAPFIVDKYTGQLTVTGTAYQMEQYLLEYEKQHGY